MSRRDPHAEASAAAAEALTAMLADGAASPWDVNCGRCEDFDDEMVDRLGGECDDVMTLDTLNFWEAETAGETVTALKNIGAKAILGLTLRQWATAAPGGHVWAFAYGRHYDAECLEGTENLLELPIIRRAGIILAALRDKDVAASHAHWKENDVGEEGEDWRILHYICSSGIDDEEFTRRVVSECASTDRPDLAGASALALAGLPGAARWLESAASLAAGPRP